MVLCGLARAAVAAAENMQDLPPLISLHSDGSLNSSKLDKMRRISTEALETSLCPEQTDCLKTRPDGTILDGHHRIYILRERGEDVDALPREVVARENS